jgi:hypothetical protein
MVFGAFWTPGIQKKDPKPEQTIFERRKWKGKNCLGIVQTQYVLQYMDYNSNIYVFWFYRHPQLVSSSLQVTNHHAPLLPMT